MTEIGPKNPRLYDPGYLAFLRTKPCCVCYRAASFFNPVDPAHIRIGLFAMQMKPDDRYATPLCRQDHDAQHAFGSESEWWRLTGLDPFEVAATLYAEYGGDGGHPRKRRATIKPKLVKAERSVSHFPAKRKIAARANPWAKRKFK